MPGRLLVVATPIGNLGDLSARAREALAGADLVACEDTRRTGQLMSHLGLRKPLLSLHEHNERLRLPRLLAELAEGRTIALVSDAGTPLLVASGLPPYPFTFAGFPPPKTGKRRELYRRFAELPHTLVFFESPHRIVASLADALEVLGDRPAAVARELTKLHEEVLRGLLSELHAELAARPAIKGEIVLVVGGCSAP